MPNQTSLVNRLQAFQVPVRWWDALSAELADPYMGPQWRFWLKAVQDVFQARAEELKSTPGAAALHVIVNPNGTIFNIVSALLSLLWRYLLRERSGKVSK